MMFYSFRNLVIAYVILIAVVLSVLLLALSNFLSQEKHLSSVNISRESLQKLELTSANFNEFVIGLNTYINTGGEHNLSFYTRGLEKLKNDSLQIIEIANSDATKNKNEYRVLAGLLHEITSLASSVLHTNDTKGFDVAKAGLKKGNITKISSAFKTLFEILQTDDRRVLREAFNRNTKLIRRTFIYTGIISVLLVLLLVAVAGNIKKRIRAEEKLQRFNEELEKQVNEKTLDIKESEEKYRTLIEQASDAIFINDVKGNLLDANTNAYEMLGYTKDQLRQMNLKDLYTPEELLRKPIMYEELLRGKRTSLERNMLHKDGFLIPVDITAKMLSDGRIIAIVRDITEKKKAEEALLRSKQNYSSLIDTIDGIVWEADVQTFQFSFVSKRAEKLLGYPVAQWFKDPAFWPDHIHPDDRTWAVEYCIRCTAEKKSHEFEYRMIAADGQLVWLRDIVTVIVENDKAVQLRGIMVDITEKKKAENELKESEERYRSVIEQASDAIFITEEKGDLIDVNTALCNQLGYSKEELIGLNVTKIIDAAHLKISPLRFDLVFAGEVVVRERKMRHKNGSIVEMEIKAKMLPDKRILVIARDVTERKKIESKLIEQEKQLRLFVEHSPASLAMLDNDMRYIVTSRKWKTAYNLGDREIIGKSHYEVFPGIPQRWKDIHQRCLAGAIEKSDEDSFIRTDGSTDWLSWEIHPWYKASGQVGGIIMFTEVITERKEAERKLKESAARLTLSAQIAKLGYWELDPVKNQFTFSDEFYAIFKTTSEEMGGYTMPVENYLKQFVHPDEITIVGDEISKALKSEDPDFLRQLEHRIIYANGEAGYISVNCFIVKDDKGNTIKAFGVNQDITERKKAEEILSNNELRFRTLTVNAPVGIFQTDANGKTIYVNETWLQYTGLRFNEAIGDGWVQAVHPDDREMLVKEWETKSQKGLRSSLEYRLLNKNGNIRWVSGKAIPLFNQAGEINGHIGTLSDITERKNTEQIIRNSEETRKLIMNSALDAIICIDTQGCITVWTPQAEKIFGWNEQDAMGKVMADIIIPAQYREQHKKGLANYLKTGEGPVLNRIFEITALNHEGNEFPIEISIIPIKHGSTEFFCAFIRDISDRKKAEVELEESYKAIRKLTAHLQNIREEERIHIAREIHDELGQHLTVLKMDIAWLSKKITKSADDETKVKIKDLINIIDGTIKTVRRISAELRPSLLDDLGLVAALEWQLDEFEKRSGIRTNFKEPDEEIQLTSAVKTGLFRIFQESLTNVARHAGATKVKVSLVQTESSVELNITDNGKGFDKLKIADKRTLGLLGMRERTAMIGGTYDIISTPGKGTTVVVTIPLEPDSIKELV